MTTTKRFGFYGRAGDGTNERLLWNERQPPIPGKGAANIGEVWLDFTGTTAQVDAETERRNCHGPITPPAREFITGPVIPVTAPGCEHITAPWIARNRRLYADLTA